jgi:peroxiredoxin Q/BCP
MNMRFFPLVLTGALVLACDKGDTAKDGASPTASVVPALEAKPPAEGDAAPRVTFKLQDGKTTSVADYAGKYLVVYFYPKDDTPGCTTEALGFRDSYKELQAFDVQVLGVSTQDAASHQAFMSKHELPFPLVVDSDESVAKAFGVPVRLGIAARQTFLIGPGGELVKIWRDVKPEEQAQAILDLVVAG